MFFSFSDNFDKLISYHDLKKKPSHDDLILFENKYLRRYFRLIHSIYEEDVIFFIRYGKTQLIIWIYCRRKI